MNETVINGEIPELVAKLRTYKQKHIYNCDEPDLNYQMASNRRITYCAMPGRKSQKSRMHNLQ